VVLEEACSVQSISYENAIMAEESTDILTMFSRYKDIAGYKNPS
jgi:hypothetical protein